MARPKKVQPSSEVDTQTFEPKGQTQLELTPEEIKAILAVRSRQTAPDAIEEPKPAKEPVVGISELAAALVQAIETTRPPQKKTVFNRIKRNPWAPKDGSPKIMSFKRPMFHHGIPINPKTTTNENCKLLDKIKPGTYCNGHITVRKRKDNGYDIDYPVRTAAQRLKLNQFGITSFESLLQRLIDERSDPKRYAQPEDVED